MTEELTKFALQRSFVIRKPPLTNSNCRPLYLIPSCWPVPCLHTAFATPPPSSPFPPKPFPAAFHPPVGFSGIAISFLSYHYEVFFLSAVPCLKLQNFIAHFNLPRSESSSCQPTFTFLLKNRLSRSHRAFSIAGLWTHFNSKSLPWLIRALFSSQTLARTRTRITQFVRHRTQHSTLLRNTEVAKQTSQPGVPAQLHELAIPRLDRTRLQLDPITQQDGYKGYCTH